MTDNNTYNTLIETTTFDEMLHVKQYIDMNFDLYDLVFNHFTKEERESVLSKISSLSKGHENSLVHIVSDVDDTLFLSMEHASDNAFDNVNDFHELIRHTSYSTLLTVRHRKLRNLLKRKLQKMQLLNDGVSVLDYNTSTSEYLFIGLRHLKTKFNMKLTNSSNTTERLICHPEHYNLYLNFGQMKYQKFANYQLLFPEYNLLFIGDSAQGDVACAKLIHKNFPTKKTFIHNLFKNDEKQDREYSDEEKKILQRDFNIYLFESYADANKIISNYI